MKKLLVILFCIFCFSCVNAKEVIFQVEPSLDTKGYRERAVVFLGETNYLKVYVDKEYWNDSKQEDLYSKIYDLVEEFGLNIYPMITNVYGKSNLEDKKFDLVLVPIKDTHEAYFIKEKDNLYLDINSLYQYDDNEVYYFLSHEFMHLVSQYQKEDVYGVREEVFLEEARAEYTETLLGYLKNSRTNLKTRIRDFVNCNHPSFLDFKNTKQNYASVNLFVNYLVEHYGMDILVDSFNSDKVGVDSINYALKKNGYQIKFDDIYLDWLIASYINDCSINNKYCYFNDAFKNVTLIPYTSYIPTTGEVSLSTTKVLKKYDTFFEKILGGNGDIVLKISNILGEIEKIPYIVMDSNEKYSVGILDLSKQNQIKIEDFGKSNISIVMIFSSFDDVRYTWQVENNLFNKPNASSVGEVNFQIGETENALIQVLLRYIDLLKLKLELLKIKY